jgi:hypothetical protein
MLLVEGFQKRMDSQKYNPKAKIADMTMIANTFSLSSSVIRAIMLTIPKIVMYAIGFYRSFPFMSAVRLFCMYMKKTHKATASRGSFFTNMTHENKATLKTTWMNAFILFLNTCNRYSDLNREFFPSLAYTSLIHTSFRFVGSLCSFLADLVRNRSYPIGSHLVWIGNMVQQPFHLFSCIHPREHRHSFFDYVPQMMELKQGPEVRESVVFSHAPPISDYFLSCTPFLRNPQDPIYGGAYL